MQNKKTHNTNSAKTNSAKTNINTKPNILLIVIDALRARNVGTYGMPGNPTENIDLLAETGVLFDSTYSCWNTTDQSLTTILSGRYPRSHGIMNHGDKVSVEERNRFLRTGTKLLAEILKNSGYGTMAVDWMGRWFKRGFDYYGYDVSRKGWERFHHYVCQLPALYYRYLTGHLPILKCYSPMRRSSLKDLGKGIKDVFNTFLFTFRLAQLHDARYVSGIAQRLIEEAENSGPFFLFLHYWDTHTPYNCPAPFMKNNKHKSDPQSLLAGKYNGAVSYVDHHLGQVFNRLKKSGLWDNTLIIVTSDHGDSLTEHDIYFDHHGLYEETTHVPLILHYPRALPKGLRVGEFVQHVDLLPTICDLLGIPSGPFQFDGYSLLPLLGGETGKIRDHIFVEESYVQNKAALRTKEHKYIMATDGVGWCNYCQKVHVGKEELYDLRSDPRENRDISRENPSLSREKKEQLQSIIQSLDQKRERQISEHSGPSEEKPHDLKAEEKIRKRLKDLGYMQ